MALSGFKDFATGAILTEDDLDEFLMQGVLVFANSTARDTALGTTAGVGGLQHGRVCYLTGTNVLQYYNNTTWVDVATAASVSAIDTRSNLIRIYMEAGLSAV